MSVALRRHQQPMTKMEFYDFIGTLSAMIHKYIMRNPLSFRPYVFDGQAEDDMFFSRADYPKREYYLASVELPDVYEIGDIIALTMIFKAVEDEFNNSGYGFRVYIPASPFDNIFMREHCRVNDVKNPNVLLGYSDFEDEMHLEQFARIYDTMLYQHGNEINLDNCSDLDTPKKIMDYFTNLFAFVDEKLQINFLNLEEAKWFAREFQAHIGDKSQIARSFQSQWQLNATSCGIKAVRSLIELRKRSKEMDQALEANPYAGLL